MKISELKKEAKVKLSRCFQLALGINLIHLLITLALSYVASAIDGILGIIVLIIAGIINIPLGYGLTASMLKLSRNENVGIIDFIKVGFKNFKRAFFLSLSIFVRLLIPMIILVAASVTPIIMTFANNIDSVNNTEAISVVALILAVASVLYIIYKVLSYTLSTYLLVDNEEAKSKDVLTKSSELMKGNKLKFVGLVFSFFGWVLLAGIFGAIAEAISSILGAIVTYGLSLLLTPYISFTEINFYEDLAGVSNTQNPIQGEVTDSTVE